MSEEYVEIVRRVYDAAAGRDTATVRSLYDPNIETDMRRARQAGDLFGRGGFYRGWYNLQQWFREWSEGLNDLHWEAELIEAGNRVISKATMTGRGRTSGIEVGGVLYAVWTIRVGKIVRVVWFPSRDEALEAVGLRE